MTDIRMPNRDDRAAAQAWTARVAAFERLGALVVVLDGSVLIVDTNESWRLFARLNDGSRSATGLRVNYLDVCDRTAANGSSTAPIVAAGLRQVLAGERDQFTVEYPCPTPTEDRWFLLQVSAAAVVDCAGLVMLHVDITARKALSDRPNALASDDGLTGLPNRRMAVEYPEAQFARTDAPDEPIWVLFVDVDDFKSVNDRYGHRAGDELLVKIAARARHVVRHSDILCPFGGDEFVVICLSITRDGAGELASRLRTVMADHSRSERTSCARRSRSGLHPAPARQPSTHSCALPTPKYSSTNAEPADAIRNTRHPHTGPTSNWGTRSPATSHTSSNRTAKNEFIDLASIPGLDDRISTPPNKNHRNARTDLDDDRVTDLDDDLNVRDGVAHGRDVTDKVRADDANRFQALLLSAVGQSVIASDADGVITYWNAAAETMFGWVPDEVIGDRLVSILPIHPRSLSDANEVQWNSSQICSGELWLRTRSGSSIPVMQT